MKYIFAIIILLCLNINAEDKYAKKGDAWQVWKAIEEHGLKQNKDELLKLIGGDLLKIVTAEIKQNGMKSFAGELKKMNFDFVRELKDKEKIFLVLRSKTSKNIFITLVFAQEDNKLKWFKTLPGQKVKKAENNKKRQVQGEKINAKAAKVKNKLKKIASAVHAYFADGTFACYPENQQQLKIDPDCLSYTHPETGKIHKFLIIQGKGIMFTGRSDFLIAVSDAKIHDKYWAVFEDGHVETISDADFKKHKFILGLIDLNDETKKEVSSLIAKLGAKTSEERKEAKEKLIKMGPDILTYLKEKSKKDDNKQVAAIKGIIDTLEKNANIHERPSTNTKKTSERDHDAAKEQKEK